MSLSRRMFSLASQGARGFTFIAALCSAFAVAQTGRGVVIGRVSDAGGAVLWGAKAILMPSGAQTITNEEGQFSFFGVPAGDSTVEVSYVGFSTYQSSVKVVPGQTVHLDAVLRVASQTEEVLVTAERQRGEAEAINRMRASDNILQVLPVEVITSLPNTNIADALGRLPSVTLERDEGEGKYVQIRGAQPNWSNVTINGVNVPSPEADVRQIKLDIIPANLVDSVEINKTLSANQDGDAIGGSVNLVTKTAEERPTLYLNGIGGYTPIIGGRSAYEFDGTVGKRFGASKKLGILFGGSYDWNGRGIDDVEPVPDALVCGGGSCVEAQPGDSGPFFSSYPTEDIREYRYYRERYGFTGSVDYKLGDVSGLYARFLYSHFNNFGDRWVYSPSINSFVTPTQGGNDGSISFNAQIRRPVEVIGSLDAGGKHTWTRWVLAYEVAVSRSAAEDHGYSSADFNGPSGSDDSPLVFNVDTSNPLKPKLIPQGGFSTIYNPATYSLADIDVSTTYSPQVNLQAGFSAARNYNINGHFGTFAFGAKFRNAHKFQDAVDPTYNVADGVDPASVSMSNFLGSFRNPDYYDGSYTFGPTVDYGKVRSFFNANRNNTNVFALDAVGTALNTFSNNYDLVERVSAGYLMNTLQFGRVRLQTGLRFESTSEDVLGNIVGLDDNGNPTVSPLRHTTSYLDPLPSVQVKFALPHDAAIRASYSRGIARPNFSDLPPKFDSTNAPDEIDIGNPNLKATHSNNFDLLFEQYLKPLGILQAGFFYKQLSDPIYQQRTIITQEVIDRDTLFGPLLEPFLGDPLVQSINGSNANLLGFEIAYQQHLSFLPSFLSSLGISANYSYTHSSTDGVPLRTDHPALQRQAPNSWNISPTYDRARLSVRVGISHNDANIFSYGFQNKNDDGSIAEPPLGIKGPHGDTYLYAHTQVDAQAAIRLRRGLQFIVSGLNLTNEVFGFYNGSQQFPIQREFYKPTYSFGLRYTLTNEPK